MTDATQSGKSKPEAADTATEMGVMSVMVPTEVPMASETKQLTTNKNGHRKLGWDERKHEVRDAFGAVAAYGAYEYASCHEDEDHGDDCLVANAAPHDGQLVIEAEFAILEACH